MDKKIVEAESDLLYKTIGLTDPGPNRLTVRIKTIVGLSKAFDDLVDWLTWVAEETTPPRKENRGYSSRWWSREVEEANREARGAERLARERTG